MPVLREGFLDRAYLPDGTLAPRGTAGAVLGDPERVVEQALRLATEGRVRAVDGSELELQVDTLCLHGDTAAAVALARRVRSALEGAGVGVAGAGAASRHVRIRSAGPGAWYVDVADAPSPDTALRLGALQRALLASAPGAVRDVVPGYTSVLVEFRPGTSPERLRRWLQAAERRARGGAPAGHAPPRPRALRRERRQSTS